jgi:glycosyltransferase involved in cell wall biosynthesis
MLVSLLIANFNNGHFFRDCFESILAQSYTNWEVVVVDDCSTDDSIKQIEQIVRGDARVKIISNTSNKGVGYSKHKAVQEASGELCAFLDPDDMLENEALKTMVLAFQSNPSTVLAHSSFRMYDENLQLIGSHQRAKSVNFSDPYFFNFDGEITHFAMFLREAYLRTTGIDPYMKRAVDQDLYLKLCEQGNTHFVDEFLYKYRIHAMGISTGASSQNAQKALYWHWYACNQAAKRRGIVIEDLFLKQFALRTEVDTLNKQLVQTKTLAQQLRKLVQTILGK